MSETPEVKLEEPRPCDDCGRVEDSCRATNCPYAEEISRQLIEIYVCDDCYHERCMDI